MPITISHDIIRYSRRLSISREYDEFADVTWRADVANNIFQKTGERMLLLLEFLEEALKLSHKVLSSYCLFRDLG